MFLFYFLSTNLFIALLTLLFYSKTFYFFIHLVISRYVKKDSLFISSFYFLIPFPSSSISHFYLLFINFLSSVSLLSFQLIFLQLTSVGLLLNQFLDKKMFINGNVIKFRIYFLTKLFII